MHDVVFVSWTSHSLRGANPKWSFSIMAKHIPTDLLHAAVLKPNAFKLVLCCFFSHKPALEADQLHCLPDDPLATISSSGEGTRMIHIAQPQSGIALRSFGVVLSLALAFLATYCSFPKIGLHYLSFPSTLPMLWVLSNGPKYQSRCP